ncbi:MAG: hypothetical protein KAI29_26420, partial [Cyclobacteriaceae bacterium]|nr:hypothetical protein [Cyclobacteriaceae bacterium]
MGLMWLSVGILTGISAWILHVLNKRYLIDLVAWLGLISGIFSVLFGIAWSVSSVLEGVPRSGSMGILLFGGLGLIILLLTWRFNLQHSKKPEAMAPDQDEISTPENTNSDQVPNSRRNFLNKSLIGALSVKHIIGGTIGLGAGITSAVAIKRASGKVLDDVPNAIR